MRFIIAMVASALLVFPAAAEWSILVSDRGDIRSVMLLGFDDADSKRQMSVICTTLDGERIGDPVVTFSAPSTGQFTVRPGEAADVTITAGANEWALPANVDQNDSTAFAASIKHMEGIVIAAAAGEMAVAISAGDVWIEINIGSGGSAEASRQFAEACGQSN